MIQIKEETMRKKWVVFACAIVCCLLWGSAFPCIKTGYEMFAVASSDTPAQILFAGCRFTLAGVLVVLMGSALQGRFIVPSKKALPKIGIISLFQTVIQYFLFYVGLAHTTGVKSSIIVASNVFLGIIISSLIFRQEKLSLKKLIGCTVGFAGVVIVNLNGLDMNMSMTGEGFILLSSLASALSAVLIKAYSKDEDPVMLSGYQFMLGGVIMILGGLATGGRLTVFNAGCAAMLTYLALISSVAYTLWGILLKYNPVSRVLVFGFTNPLFGVILSALVLGEGTSFGVRGIIALVLVCAGIYVVNKE